MLMLYFSLQPANYLLSRQERETNSYLIMKSTDTKQYGFCFYIYL